MLLNFKPEPIPGERRIVKRFAILPTRCDVYKGRKVVKEVKVWLETYLSHEIYKCRLQMNKFGVSYWISDWEVQDKEYISG